MSTLSDKDLPDEQQLDDYLRGGSDVSRQYRQLHSAEVPADLDRLVLRQAQEAVKARPAKSRKWMRWAGPLALAASTVLVVSIVIESGVHEKTYLTAPASAPAEVTMPQAPAERPAVGNAAENAEKRAVEQDKTAGVANDASVVHVLPLDSPPVADLVYDAPAPVVPETPAPSQQRSFAIPQPAPAAAPAAAPPPAPQIQSTPPAEEVEVRARKLQRQEMNSRSVAAPVTTSEDIDSLQEVAVTGTRRRESAQSAGPRNTIAAPAARESRGDADEERAEQPHNYSDPEQWLRDIRELRKANKQEEADREWRRFRYVFPNYEVAEKDLARGPAVSINQ